jgi:hypothetical protein
VVGWYGAWGNDDICWADWSLDMYVLGTGRNALDR